jgi:hypothetical protein
MKQPLENNQIVERFLQPNLDKNPKSRVDIHNRYVTARTHRKQA